MKNDEFSTSLNSADSLMSVNGGSLTCVFNSPPALRGEKVHDLPPYATRKAYSVDEYQGCPTNWMHGSALAKSYFVPIKAEHGMWLDFNGCYKHSHHVAIVISVQGINPLTGMPQIDEALRLEQYREQCPKHKKGFEGDLYCPDCKYQWCPQNYLTTTSTPNNLLWLDGFRADDGTVRQYYFTEEEAKGVAAQVIGDKRVYAIGIAFYLSKECKKVAPQPITTYYPSYPYPYNRVYPHVMYKTRGGSGIKKRLFDADGGKGFAATPDWSVTYNDVTVPGHKLKSLSVNDSGGPTCSISNSAAAINNNNNPTCSASSNNNEKGDLAFCDYDEIAAPACPEKAPSKLLEIGAGAKISQKVYRDLESLDFWQAEPAGMLYINYIDIKTAQKIIKAGKRDLTAKGEGFLAGLKVGK